jgi:hypothetical protein
MGLHRHCATARFVAFIPGTIWRGIGGLNLYLGTKSTVRVPVNVTMPAVTAIRRNPSLEGGGNRRRMGQILQMELEVENHTKVGRSAPGARFPLLFVLFWRTDMYRVRIAELASRGTE